MFSHYPTHPLQRTPILWTSTSHNVDVWGRSTCYRWGHGCWRCAATSFVCLLFWSGLRHRRLSCEVPCTQSLAGRFFVTAVFLGTDLPLFFLWSFFPLFLCFFKQVSVCSDLSCLLSRVLRWTDSTGLTASFQKTPLICSKAKQCGLLHDCTDKC